MIKPCHPNTEKVFEKGAFRSDVSPAPYEKFFRYRPDDEVQRLANDINRYVALFSLSDKAIHNIIRSKFHQSVGNDTLRIFLNKTYGCGMRPRPATLAKYKFLLSHLKSLSKEFKDTSCNTVDL